MRGRWPDDPVGMLDSSRATRGRLTSQQILQLPSELRDVSIRHEDDHAILTVRDPTALIQTIGYLKYKAPAGYVLFRGQTRRHADMMASGLRGLGKVGRQSLAGRIRSHLADLANSACMCLDGPFSFGQAHRCIERVQSGPIAAGTPYASLEPLLQHYGLKTRWLDAVDNVWVALWFATHEQVTAGRFGYHQRLSESSPGATTYIAVIRTGELSPTGIAGYQVGTETRLIDLRYAVPSIFLRPHAQHGLLVAPAHLDTGYDGSLKGNVLAYLEISLSNALAWLGAGQMTSAYTLFPPAVRDRGYRRLISSDVRPPDGLGDVILYGPGN